VPTKRARERGLTGARHDAGCALVAAIRDVQERGRDIKYVLRQYINHVKPAFDDYIFPVRLGRDTR